MIRIGLSSKGNLLSLKIERCRGRSGFRQVGSSQFLQTIIRSVSLSFHFSILFSSGWFVLRQAALTDGVVATRRSSFLSF